MVLLRQRLKIHAENAVRAGTLPAGGLDRTLKNGFLLIRDHQIRIRHQLEAQTGAIRAGAAGIVEGITAAFRTLSTRAGLDLETVVMPLRIELSRYSTRREIK